MEVEIVVGIHNSLQDCCKALFFDEFEVET